MEIVSSLLLKKNKKKKVNEKKGACDLLMKWVRQRYPQKNDNGLERRQS
jgi:hypothetical protein